ncbi:MAG: serine/threonine protein kinase [Cyanobacteria bacterium LVE1205-1]|jgi:serine/threonine-protein kinase
MNASNNSPVLAIQSIIDNRYKIIKQLGEGGFGRTYLAMDDRRHGEYCVIKEFAPTFSEPDVLEKAKELFQREARVLHSLNHPQIPEFREVFDTNVNGYTYLILVQEWVPGPSYRDLLQRQRFTEKEVIAWMLDVVDILDYLHQRNPPVIHRDIAPDNLIRSDTLNKPVLIDFGAVKEAVKNASTNTPSITVLFKDGYTPREQQQGKPVPSSDLYALAVTAIVLATGKEPNDGLTTRSTGLSRELTKILKRMMAEDPKQRYSSAQEVRKTLSSLKQAPSNASALGSSSASSLIKTWLVPGLDILTRSRLTSSTQPTSGSSQKTTSNFFTQVGSPNNRFLSGLLLLIQIGIVMGVSILIATRVSDYLLTPSSKSDKPISPSTTDACQKLDQSQMSPEVIQEINEQFWQRFPEMKSKEIEPNQRGHNRYRLGWCEIANQVLKEKQNNQNQGNFIKTLNQLFNQVNQFIHRQNKR